MVKQNLPSYLCVLSYTYSYLVSTSYETTHCGICLTSNKNLHWASGGGGGVFGPKIAFFGTIFSLKIGVLLGNISESRLTVRNLFA